LWCYVEQLGSEGLQWRWGIDDERGEKNPIETGRNTTGGSSRGEILLAVESLKGMEGGA